MGENKDNGNDRFYLFKIDRDKIKLHLKEIGSKFLPRKNRRKGIILIISFFLLVGVGIGIYINYQPQSEKKYELEPGVTIESIEDEKKTGSDAANRGSETNVIEKDQGREPAPEELQYASRELNIKGNIDSEQKNSETVRIQEENTGREQQPQEEVEGVVTAPLYPVTEEETDSISLLRPIAGEIMQEDGWHFHPVFQDWRYQRGIEIKGNPGDIVMAADSGKVESVTEDEYKGIIVTINHSNGWRTCYGHLQKAAVSPGEVVGKGQEVGRVGQTGISSQPSLYFEFSNDNDPINPVKFFE